MVHAYRAQASYFKSPWDRDILDLVWSLVQQNSRHFDLNQCPQIEAADVMLPLLGALRHNTYFNSIALTECNGNQVRDFSSASRSPAQCAHLTLTHSRIFSLSLSLSLVTRKSY